MSGTRLSARARTRIREALSRYVESGTGPGAVAVVAHRGDVHVEAVGHLASNGAKSTLPMSEDTVFRVASWTKNVVAAATMSLVEDGVFRLADPIDDWVPELADMDVLLHPTGPLRATRRARRPITIEDLLTCRIGTGTMPVEPGIAPVADALTALENEPGRSGHGLDASEYLARLGQIPLVREPGEVWMYYVPAIVLGMLVERAAGNPLETVLQERIFRPLGMPDTTLRPDERLIARAAEAYRLDSRTGQPVVDSPRAGGPVHGAPFKEASSALVTTPQDFLAFTTALMPDPYQKRASVLSPRSIALMTADHLTSAQRSSSTFVWPPGFYGSIGWGYSLGIVTSGRYLAPSTGSYGWYGKFGTVWFDDPSHQLTTMLFCQTDTGWKPIPVYREFWASVYAELESPR